MLLIDYKKVNYSLVCVFVCVCVCVCMYICASHDSVCIAGKATLSFVLSLENNVSTLLPFLEAKGQ